MCVCVDIYVCTEEEEETMILLEMRAPCHIHVRNEYLNRLKFEINVMIWRAEKVLDNEWM